MNESGLETNERLLWESWQLTKERGFRGTYEHFLLIHDKEIDWMNKQIECFIALDEMIKQAS